MRTKSEELSQFKSLTLELVELSKIDDLSVESKKVVRDLTTALKYQIEYSIMNEVIKENESVKEIIPTIDEVINRIMTFKAGIYEKFRESGKEVMDLSDRIKLLTMEKNLRRLNGIKEAVEQRNFNSYINAMNNQISSSNDLVIIIKSVLSDGYNEYFSKNLIKGGKVNENVMMIIYSIMKDKTLFKELKEYIHKEHEVKELKTDYEQDERDLDMFYKCREYENEFRRYIILTSRMKEYDTLEGELTAAVSESSSKIDDLTSQKYSRVFYNSTLKKLETDVLRKKDKLDRIHKQREELKILEDKLTSLGFGPILSSFKTELGQMNNVYDKFVMYIKTKMNSDLFDVNGFITGFKERMRKKRVEVSVSERKLPGILDNDGNLTKKLIEYYHDDVEKIVNLYNVDEDMSKLIAFYVLNLLCSAKKLDYTDLNDVYVSDESMEETFKRLEECLNKDLERINEEVQDVEEDISSVMKKAG